MSIIIKHDEYVSHYAYVTYFKNEGMYEVKGTVHVNIEEASESSKEKGYENWHEVTDIELQFFVAGKKCTYVGFKELYEKLFTSSSWDKYELSLQEEFEKHYMKNKVKIK